MKRYRARLACGIATTLVVLLLLVGVLVWQFGSIRNAAAFVNGANYLVDSTLIDVGSGEQGEKRSATIRIRNLGFHPIRLVGVEMSCNCITVSDLPMTVTPGTVQSLELSIHLRGKDGAVEQIARLLFDDGGVLRTTPVVLKGRVTAIDEAEAGD